MHSYHASLSSTVNWFHFNKFDGKKKINTTNDIKITATIPIYKLQFVEEIWRTVRLEEF